MPPRKKTAKKPTARVYLTDKVEQDKVWSPRRLPPEQRAGLVELVQSTSTIQGDPTAIELPEGTICVARTDEARDRLCADLGIEPLPRVVDHTYQAGDVAIVGQLSPTHPTRWVRHTFT